MAPPLMGHFGHLHHHHIGGRGRDDVEKRDLQASHRIDGERRGIETIRHRVLVEVRLNDFDEHRHFERQGIAQLLLKHPEVWSQRSVKLVLEVPPGRA